MSYFSCLDNNIEETHISGFSQHGEPESKISNVSQDQYTSRGQRHVYSGLSLCAVTDTDIYLSPSDKGLPSAVVYDGDNQLTSLDVCMYRSEEIGKDVPIENAKQTNDTGTVCPLTVSCAGDHQNLYAAYGKRQHFLQYPAKKGYIFLYCYDNLELT